MRYAILALLLLAAPVIGQEADPAGFPEELVEGFTTGQGFTFHNNQWWKNGVAHTRRRVNFTSYSGTGCYRCAVADYRVVYTPVPYVPPANKITNITYNSNWQTEALQTLAKRDDLQAFENTFQSLNNTAITASASAGNGYNVVSGTTLYQRGNLVGLSNALYGNLDSSIALQQAARLVDGARELHKDGLNGFLDVTSQRSAAEERVAVIHALAVASQPQGQAIAQTFQYSRKDAQADAPQVMPPADGPAATAQAQVRSSGELQAVFAQSCARCHSGATAEKGFTLESYRNMDRKTKIDKVWSRLVSTDPKVLMPRKEKDGPGVPLSKPALNAFFEDMKQGTK